MDKKRVLILAGRFPPYDNPGARRPAGLYKYLREYGWEAWVITVDPEKGPNPYSYRPNDKVVIEEKNVIRTGYSNVLQLPRKIVTSTASLFSRKKAAPLPKADFSGVPVVRDRAGIISFLRQGLRGVGKLIRDMVVFPDTFFGWYPHALKAAKRLHAEVGFDAVISTSGPVTSHLIASRLKRQYPSLVWVADYRDLWSQKASREQSGLFQRLDEYLEKNTLRRADGITAVSTSFIHKLSQFGFSVPTRVIYNGYDVSEYEALSSSPPVTDKLVITHAGVIYPGYRDPLPVLEALAGLIAQGKIDEQKIEIRFYGYTADWLQRAVSDLHLDSCVIVHGRIPRTQILAKLIESTVLWVLDWEDEDETGNIPAKVFEYMGCRRYIFASGGTHKSEIAQVLNQAGIGIHVTNEQREIEVALCKLYNRYQNENYEGFTVVPEATAAFTHIKMTQEFGLLLDALISR